MARVDELHGCVMVEDQRVARLEAEVRRSVEKQENFERSVVTTEMMVDSLKQVSQIFCEQLDAVRQVTDDCFTEHSELLRDRLDNLEAELRWQSSKQDMDCVGIAVALESRIDRQVMMQQQQAEFNNSMLEVVGLSAGKFFRVDGDVLDVEAKADVSDQEWEGLRAGNEEGRMMEEQNERTCAESDMDQSMGFDSSLPSSRASPCCVRVASASGTSPTSGKSESHSVEDQWDRVQELQWWQNRQHDSAESVQQFTDESDSGDGYYGDSDTSEN